MIARKLIAGMAVAAVLAGGAGVWFRVHRTKAFFEPRALLARFPPDEASVLSVNVRLLRQAGLLSGSKAPLEADYRQFLDGTGFDYRRDLDLVVASFSDRGNYFIARGRFDWPRLRGYVAKQGGSAISSFAACRGARPTGIFPFCPCGTMP